MCGLFLFFLMFKFSYYWLVFILFIFYCYFVSQSFLWCFLEIQASQEGKHRALASLSRSRVAPCHRREQSRCTGIEPRIWGSSQSKKGVCDPSFFLVFSVYSVFLLPFSLSFENPLHHCSAWLSPCAPRHDRFGAAVPNQPKRSQPP